MDSTVPSESKLNVYGALTAKIMHAMKDAKGTYKMPWHSPVVANDLPTNAATKHVYRGVNVLSLWIDAMARRFPTGYWATYKQWQSLGVQVRYKERGSIIVFYRQFELSAEEKEAGTRARSMARASWVFNAAQVENWTPPEPTHRSAIEIDKSVEAFVQSTGANIDYGYPMAQYRGDLDRIEMPSPSWFTGTETQSASEAYHATLLHELTHWTGAAHRIGREIGKRHGVQAYAFEELIAELGAAFMCATFGIANEPRRDHAAYVATWLEVLNNDSRAIFRAASRAQEAIEYLGILAAEKLDQIEAAPTTPLQGPPA